MRGSSHEPPLPPRLRQTTFRLVRPRDGLANLPRPIDRFDDSKIRFFEPRGQVTFEMLAEDPSLTPPRISRAGNPSPVGMPC
jgi:hypothetical protein